MFVGREDELAELERAIASDRAELGIVYGRRRIGKSSLLEHAKPGTGALFFEGLESGTPQKQIDHFADQLARQTRTIPVRARSWSEAFEALSVHIRRGRHYVVFDELPWMAANRSELVALIKFHWDREWKKNPKLTLVLCGSIANFMVKHVVHSSALHNRKTFELEVGPLPAREAAAFFRNLRSPMEMAKLLMIFGGIPKYLEQIDPTVALASNMDRLCFSKNGFFVNEFETIFKEQFKVTKTYEAIAQLLAKGGRSKEQVAAGLGQAAGGGLGTYLEHLERAAFTRALVPVAVDSGRDGGGSKTKKHVLWDEWLRFYFTYVRPNLAAIRAQRGRGLFDALTGSSLDAYFGLAFERLCMRNIDAVLAALDIAPHELVEWGPFFRQPSRTTRRREGVQIDLLIRRRGDVLTVVECKFSSQPVGAGVIAEVERKIALLRAPRRFTVERVLVAANGVTSQVEDKKYFHRIVGLDALFRAFRRG